MRTPFDPLEFLMSECRLEVFLDSKGGIVTRGWDYLPEHKKRKAQVVIRTYRKLLRMHLDAPDKEQSYSVRKLLALGRIVIKDGKYVGL